MIFDMTAKGLLLGLCHFGSLLIKRGELTAGELTSYMFHSFFLGLGLYGQVQLVAEVVEVRQAAERLVDIVNSGSETAEVGQLHEFIEPMTTSVLVRFENVHFTYPGTTRATLNNFTLEISPGSVCALVGSSGCGKSTAIALLLCDYLPSSGCIFLDRQDIRNVSRDSLRGCMSISPQHSALLGHSIREAIAFGAKPGTDVSNEEVTTASTRAVAHNFVTEKPSQYEAPVGRSGDLLSGGERKRLSMARALIRPTPLLVLDEPTSGLDATTAAAVANAIITPKINGQRDRPTTLVVTHNLSLIQQCDCVAVMSETGTIVQQGHYSELVGQVSGPFAQMMKIGSLESDVNVSSCCR